MAHTLNQTKHTLRLIDGQRSRKIKLWPWLNWTMSPLLTEIMVALAFTALALWMIEGLCGGH